MSPGRGGPPAWLLIAAVVACGSPEEPTRPGAGLAGQPPARAQLDLHSIDYDDEVREADLRLKHHLEAELETTWPTKIDITHHGYDAAVELLADKDDDSDYLAWLTPYVYVVAEMLGADFEVVGTYRSKAVLDGRAQRLAALDTRLAALDEAESMLAEPAAAGDELQAAELEQQRQELEDRRQALAAERKELERQETVAGYTYRSYIVVDREEMSSRLKREVENPELPALEEYLRELEKDGTKPTFYYHSKFSTSSFFLPSVYFRDQGMIDLIRAVDVRIGLGRQGETVSSKELVKAVVRSEEPALAAVWDGTKTAFESGELHAEFGSRVHFIALESELPNDLLVASASMRFEVRQAIRRAIEEMPAGEDEETEFQLWRPIDVEATRRAHSALIGLRQLAREQIAPVTIWIDDTGAAMPAEVRAAEDAIRLSGTEFVLWNEFYAHKDFKWRLEPTHDGAIILASEIEGLPGWRQEFLISYENPTDLTERIGDLIRSRMHRLRHVWPYSKSETPIILRDVDFSVAAGETIEVQKIIWRDRETNDFQSGRQFEARVMAVDSRKFKLSSQGFDGGFDPMGSISYRAVLPRPSEERPLFKYLTALLIVLFLGATVAAALELRRPQFVHLEQTTDVINAAFRERVEQYHRPWREGGVGEVAEAHVVGQDRDAIEIFIAELKLAEGPWWQRLMRRIVSAREEPDEDTTIGLSRELLVAREQIGGTTRLAGLLEYLLRKKRLSPYIGTTVEYQAWNRAACRLFAHSVAENEDPEQPEPRLLDNEGACLTRLVSKHFAQVLRAAGREVSLFCKPWTLERDPPGGLHWLCSCVEELPVALDHHCQALDAVEGELITHLVTEVRLDPQQTIIEGQVVEAWLLGILDRPPAVIRNDEGQSCLRLRFKALAMLRGPAC